MATIINIIKHKSEDEYECTLKNNNLLVIKIV